MRHLGFPLLLVFLAGLSAMAPAQVVDLLTVTGESQGTVRISLGSTDIVNESRDYDGTMTADVTVDSGDVTRIRITALDLEIDDIEQEGNPSITLRDMRLVMGEFEGTIGAETGVVNGAFVQTGNAVVVKGTVLVEWSVGPLDFDWEYDFEEGDDVDVDFDGTATLAGDEITVVIPIDVTGTVDTETALGDLDYGLDGTVKARGTLPASDRSGILLR